MLYLYSNQLTVRYKFRSVYFLHHMQLVNKFRQDARKFITL